MREVVIVSGARTAIGNFGGTLKDIPVVQLGTTAIHEAVRRAGIRPETGKERLDLGPDKLKDERFIDLEKKHMKWDESLKPVQIDEVIMGLVLFAGNRQNPARLASVYAGLPKETPAFTINKLCASGMKAIALGAEAIMTDNADIVVAGGMESMSNVPYALPKARFGYRMDIDGHAEMNDLLLWDALLETFYDYHMGVTAENIAAKYGITRKEQDELGLMSHNRARKAIADGIFKEEIVPINIPQKKGDPVVFAVDERPMDTSLEKMAKLATMFKKDGTITAGNASGVNDAAAAVVLMSKEKAKELGIKPIVKISAFTSVALNPAYMGLGPVPAVRKLLKRTGLTLNDFDNIEMNEAFAAQAIGCIRELGVNMDKTNIHGSGISLGHPIGCTGARLVVTLMHEMRRSNLKRGLATLCVGGGQGMAIALER
jgi:acetyl-CoA C-acetyltransferase